MSGIGKEVRENVGGDKERDIFFCVVLLSCHRPLSAWPLSTHSPWKDLGLVNTAISSELWRLD